MISGTIISFRGGRDGWYICLCKRHDNDTEAFAGFLGVYFAINKELIFTLKLDC